jgi:transcription elongation factor SPT6
MDLASKRLDEVVQSGQVITGRIDEVRDKEESKFGVSLTCRKIDLENHSSFLPEGVVCQPEDLINQAFKVDKEGGANGQRKFHMRRINHPKFKNINSHKAVELLKGLEYGEFVFRPSSKGPDNITLTWKFYNNNIVHIDIQEFEKAIGASIGSKLQIGKEELFENLQEIVERYVAPCNKFMREAAGHVKFSNCIKLEEFEEILKAEKN